MMNILENIVNWSKALKPWQQDALHHLCINESLDDSAIKELVQIAKDDKLENQPLILKHIQRPSAEKTVNLTSISGVKNINALADGQRLTFCRKGLTVIYGENSSGKSGYVRILKHACSAKMIKGEELLPNIYEKKTCTGQAKLKFTVGEQTREVDWENTDEKTSETTVLSAVHVFDARTASIQIDDEKELVYKPFQIKLLEDLVTVYDQVSKQLEVDRGNLEDDIPGSVKTKIAETLKSKTEVAEMLKKIQSVQTNKSEIEDLANWSDKNKIELKELREILFEDTDKKADKLKKCQKKLRDFYGNLQSLVESAKDENLKSTYDKRQDQQTKEADVKLAAKTFAAMPVSHQFGEEVWKEMWKAALKYSEEVAYPGEKFPFTKKEATCVLCQQPLLAEGKERLQIFQKFVMDTTSQEADFAKTQYEAELEKLKTSIRTYDPEAVKKIILEIEEWIEDEKLIKNFEDCMTATHQRVKNFVQNLENKTANLPEINILPIKKMGTLPTEQCKKQVEVWQKRINKLNIKKDSQEHKDLELEFDELKDKHWLSNEKEKENVLQALDIKKKQARLNELIKDCNTRPISTKSHELFKHILTEPLKKKFAEELKESGLEDLKLDLKSKLEKGKPKIRVKIPAKIKVKTNSTVLSEGEQRCVALAAFLTEQAMDKNKSALIFDDPVSSLDHVHREQFAKRLLEISKDRQIIVFTHDLVFMQWLYELKQAPELKQYSISYKFVEKIGICKKVAPMNVQGCLDAIKSLEKDLDNTYLNNKVDPCKSWAKTSIYYRVELTILWESAVAEALSGTVRRFRDKVDMTKLYRLTAFSIPHMKLAEEKYHSITKPRHSTTMQPRILDPQALKKEINTLKNWIEEIKGLQEVAASHV